MKQEMMTKKTKKYQGFTLLEMLVVLLVIGVLVLLFVPNITKQKEGINTKGEQSLTKVVEAQVELFEMNEQGTVSYDALQAKGYLTEEQVKKAKDYGIKVDK